MHLTDILTGDYGQYRAVETLDGCKSYYFPHFDESTHSEAGALQETIYNYIEGAEVLDTVQRLGKVRILEVGFGVGLGYDATINYLVKHGCSAHQLDYVALELDEKLVEMGRELQHQGIDYQDAAWGSFSRRTELQFHPEKKIFYAPNLRVIIGNARETLPFHQDLIFDAIYQDAFSPGKNPILWTYEWFSLLKNLAHDHCVLSTYCAHPNALKSMALAGWWIKKVKGFGPKRASTRAYIMPRHEEIKVRTEQILAQNVAPLVDSEKNYLFPPHIL